MIFVLPVKGRVEALSRFLEHWALLAKTDKKIGLFVSIFGDKKSVNKFIEKIRALQKLYKNNTIKESL